MGKGKPRHNPHKRANYKGEICSNYEEFMGEFICCEGPNFGRCDKCQGNPHNCIKQKYKAIQIYNKRKQRWLRQYNPNAQATVI